MLCRVLLAAVAVVYLICVLVLSGMQKEDLDMSLLNKLQRHNINADDINSDTVRQECQVNSSELSFLKTRRNNDNSSYYQNITTNSTSNVYNSSKTDINNTKTLYNYNTTTEASLTKDVLNTGFNETKVRNPYEVEATEDHNIKTRSSVNYVTSTQTAKQFSEAITFFGTQKNIDNIMNMFQTFLIAKLAENNNTGILKGFTTSQQISTIPPTKSIEITTGSKKKDSDLIKVLATFVFKKPVPVEPLLNNLEAKSAKTDRPDECSNDDTKTTELFPDQDYLDYKGNTAEITSSADVDYKPSGQSNLEQMINEFRTINKRKPKITLKYKNKESSFATSKAENIYVPNMRQTLKYGATRKNDRQTQFDDFEYSKVDDIIQPEKRDTKMKNEAAKSLHPDVIKEIADTVKDLVLRDLRKEILPSTETVSSIVTTTEKITTTIPQKLEKNQNNIQQATHAIQKFVDLLEQLKSAKEFIVSPVKYDSSKENNKNSEFRVEAQEQNKSKQIKPGTKNMNNFNKMNGYMPNEATINGYKMPRYNEPMQYPQQNPIVSYLDNMPNKMVPPLMSNPYGVQQPGGRTIINVPQGLPHNNKPNTINIITPVNHTPLININQMRPAPITIQTSKEIPPLGIAVSMPSTLNRNIVMPMQPAFITALNETERQRWEYILKYGRNPDTRNEITDRKDKLSQYTNFKNEPNKKGSDKKTDSSLLNFFSSDKEEKLTDYTRLSLPTLNIREQDKTDDSTFFASLSPNTRERNRDNDPKTFTIPAVNKQERERIIHFNNYNLPNLNIREADRLSSSKTFNSLDKQEPIRMIDPTLTTIDQAKDMQINKLNTNYKQQQVYDEAVLSDINPKLLYKDRYRSDGEYRGLAIHQTLRPRIAEIPKHDYPNVFNPRFLEASANYPHIDPNANLDYNVFANRGPYREYIDKGKQRDPLYVPRKDIMPKQIHDIKGFHDKLERGDYTERQDPVNEWYKSQNMPRQYDLNANKYDETDYSKTRIESRQQLPLTGKIRMSKFDDTHFKNFLKTQQKVNDMLERILATKTMSDLPSVETT